MPGVDPTYPDTTDMYGDGVTSDSDIAGCSICGSSTDELMTVLSQFSHRDFHLRRCSQCGFVFVSDPRFDFENLYNDDYYAGKGADPTVDYWFESRHPDRTVRKFEWQGVYRAIRHLTTVDTHTRWLDYGCGTGGFVRYLKSIGVDQAYGFEEGRSGEALDREGLPRLRESELGANAGLFDVVTAIEVIEHVSQPVETLSSIHRLLRPGGLLFLTTGNAQPYAHRFGKWPYVRPDIHVSYFEPGNLGDALARAGFAIEYPGYVPGWDDIIKFKLLKAFNRKTTSPLMSLLPWRAVARFVDSRRGVSAHPVGRVPQT